MTRNKTNKKHEHNRPNVWGMIQNVLIASMNKGQFIIGLVGMSFIILILKVSPSDSKELLYQIIEKFENYYILGWFFFVVSVFGWYYTAKKLRKTSYEEILRISNEKKKLQQLNMNKKMKTSK